MNDTDKDLELLLDEVRRAAAVHGAKTIRRMILAFDAHAGVETASIALADSGGTVALTADELSYAKKHGLDVTAMAKIKAESIANRTYPGLSG